MTIHTQTKTTAIEPVTALEAGQIEGGAAFSSSVAALDWDWCGTGRLPKFPIPQPGGGGFDLGLLTQGSMGGF